MSSTSLKKSLPLVVVLAFVAVLLPFATIAQANHGSRSLQVNPEHQTKDPAADGEENGIAVLTAVLSAAPTQDTGAINIDFELEEGPNDTNGNTPTVPDRTCSIPAGQTTCSVSYDGEEAGLDQWRVWIDHDGNNSTVEADPTEGPDEEDEPGTPSTGNPAPTLCRANQGEPASADCTDVVLVRWSGIRHPGSVDCDDSGGPNTEFEVNRSGGGSSSNETYNCEVFDENGDPLVDRDPDDDDDPNDDNAQATTIYMENEGGANDPDDGASYGSPDESCQTSTGVVAGEQVFEPTNECSIEVTQFELENGDATLCFWAVGADDASIEAAGQAHCANETVDENQTTNAGDTANDLADKTLLRWEPAVAASLDVETETATLTLGEPRDVVATVYDQFGAPFPGDTTVNFEFFRGSPTDKTDENADGNTPATVDASCTTDEGSTCTFTYTQDTMAGRDLICGWITETPTLSGTSRNASGTCDSESRNDPDDAPDTADSPDPADDDVDVVETTWLNDPAATQLDCRPENSSGLVRSTHKVTCKASTDQPDSAIANTEIDVELTGANDPDNSNTPATPDKRCTTNDEGECSIRLKGKAAKEKGTTVYRAWIDSDYEDSTVEADMDEQRDEEAEGGAGATEEPDNTDVVQRKWLGGDRELDLNVSDRNVNRGQTVTLFGDIDGEAPECENGETVKLKARQPGEGFHTVRETTSDNNGNFSFEPIKVWKDTDFKAVAPKAGVCKNAASEVESVNAS